LASIHIPSNSELSEVTGRPKRSNTAEKSSNTDTVTVALSWTELSTGEFHIESVPFQQLGPELARLNPSEIVVDTTTLSFLSSSEAYKKIGVGVFFLLMK
jgi:DNA mismatch repair ATPase MutS